MQDVTDGPDGGKSKDEDLLPRVGRDKDALALFFTRHVEAVMRFMARRTNNPQDVADLTAEVFLAVLEGAHTWKPERGEPRPWLFGIARHVVATHHRQDRRRTEREAAVAGWRPLHAEDVDRMIERIDAEAAARTVQERMGSLSVAERSVIELVAVDGLTVAQAAAVLGIRPGTARVRLLRARRALAAAGQRSAAPGADDHSAGIRASADTSTPISERS